MIPVQLRLKNFLSYRDVTLDFRGIHVACVCGPNGAGKSSLLEAIVWAIWGQSRATAEDDVIHMGELEARVDVTFICQQHTYRVVRIRYRGQGAALEFQVQAEDGFRTLTGRGMKATQRLIQHHIHLDYDTFVNSAYLRQGRADEFMLKRPGERKQILADLLKLSQYDDLADRAKEHLRQIKAEMGVLERTIVSTEHQLQGEPALLEQIRQLEAAQSSLQRQQQDDQAQLKQLHVQQQQRQTWLQEYALVQQRQQYLRQEGDRLSQEQATLQHQCQILDTVLARADAITQTYARFQALQAEEEQYSQRFQRYQNAYQRQHALKQQHAEAIAQYQNQLCTLKTQLAALKEQEQEIEHILRKRNQVQDALARLHQAKAHLAALDQVQTQAVPLLQRKQQLQQQLQQQHIRLSTQLEELHASASILRQQHTQHPELEQTLLTLASQLDYLEKRRHYQQLVLERGTERRAFMERLQERQRELEKQMVEAGQKIHWLQVECSGVEREGMRVKPGSEAVRENKAVRGFPPCPLCDRPLDADHWQVVLARHETEHQDIRSQIWVIREQLSASEKEIQVLRQEYLHLDQELAAYEDVLRQRGRVEAQLQSVEQSHTQLQTLLNQAAHLESLLQREDYGAELRDELTTIDITLNQLQYDERSHALARGQVDQLRWAEIKAAELQQADKRRSRLLVQRQDLEAQRQQIQHKLTDLDHSPLQQELNALEQDIQQTGYDAQAHTQVRQALRQVQSAPLRYQEMMQARQQHPLIQKRVRAIAQALHDTQQALQTTDAQLTEMHHTLTQHPDCGDAVHALEQSIQQRRSHLDDTIAQLGRLHQQQRQFNALKHQQHEHQATLQQLKYQSRIYQELATAFGKNGIQALMIENILPQLEAESNRILGQLSANQLHIQFVTQRASKRQSRASRKMSPKLIDTLDILIADTQGTRPYETYSGGEAFRVNFAIRLAIARLLAQRSGNALQMLIIDEGFGTQDQAGCDRLVSAINAIAPDFACILTVTHMPHLKEAFQTRIEVAKAMNGSSLSVIN